MSFKSGEKEMKKALIALVALAVFSTGILFAGGQQEQSAVTEEKAVLKAALLTSGPINDGGWNTLAYEGLVALQDEYGFEIAYTENVQQSAQKGIIRNYAKKGYNLIIGHGYEYGESLMQVAPDFPDTNFYNVGGVALADNVGSGIFVTDGLAYMVGVLAAKYTTTNKIGFVGAMEIPTIVNEVKFIKQTVTEVNPEATVTTAFTGSWTDVNKGKEAAMAQINQGCDIIIGIGDAVDFGAIKAAEEAGVHVIGWTGDFNHLAPETVLCSGVQDVPMAIITQGEAMAKGEWKAEHIELGVTNGTQHMGTWSSAVPVELKSEILELEKQILAGEFVPVLKD